MKVTLFGFGIEVKPYHYGGGRECASWLWQVTLHWRTFHWRTPGWRWTRCFYFGEEHPLPYFADFARNYGCPLPPPGWWCSRTPGHEGPCAARPVAARQVYRIHREERDAADMDVRGT